MRRLKLRQWAFPGRLLLMAFFALLVQLPAFFLLPVKASSPLTQQVLWVGLYLLAFCALFTAALWACRACEPPTPPARPWRVSLDWVLGGYLVVFAAQSALTTLNRALYRQSQTANNQAIIHLMERSPLAMGAMCLGAVVFSPLVEELLFRGLLMNLFFKPGQFWAPVVVSALVFCLEHASTTPISYLVYLALGLVFGYVYRKSGNLKYSIGVHALNNLVAMSLVLINLLTGGN